MRIRLHFPLSWTTKVPIDVGGPPRLRQHLATPLPVQLHPRSARHDMHPVLLVDELLQEVLDHCCSENEYRKLLVQLARCCKAWKEPALRKAWEDLPSITPLMELVVSAIASRKLLNNWLTQLQTTDSSFLEKLDSYARMVKHVTLGTKVEKDTALENLFYDTTPLFPNLQSVAVLMDGCAAPAVHFLLSPMLTAVNIDVGVSTGRATGVERSGNIAAYLSALKNSSIPIRKLNIRGFACEKLNRAVCGMSTLRSLSLKVGTSLSTATVVNIANFSLLEDLFIHADRVDADSLKESLASSSSAVFRNLRTLDIRSSAEVAATIIEHVRSTSFTRFSIEVTQDDDSIWTHLYSVIPTTIQDIRIDHHIDLEEPTNDATDTNNYHPFSIRKLGALSKLTSLSVLRLETNAPVDFVDRDVEKLTKWWPAMKILDLAISPPEECKGGEQEAPAAPWTPKLTVGCLHFVAKGWPLLERLSLPINLASESREARDFLIHTRLHQFKAIPSLSVEPCTRLIDANIAFIRNLFPAVRDDFSVCG